MSGAPDGHPDEVLVTRAARGDPYAFEELVRRHQQRMFAVALRITGRRDDAEDATQNAFVAAWRKLPAFHHEAAFGTWLYRIVVNHALNQLRARRRTDETVDLASLPDAAQPRSTQTGPADNAQSGAILDDLRSAVAALPPELRECWWAREVDRCSYQQIAELTGVGFDVARGRVYRARRRIADAMAAWR